MLASGWVTLIGLASTLWPLIRFVMAERSTALLPTALWLLAAWTAGLAAVAALLFGFSSPPLLHLTFALIACAFVSVLGARRPGLGAWNFVTGGLLAVLLLPCLEQPMSAPQWMLDTPWALLMGAILAVGIVNYLPTRWGPAALATAPALAGGILSLHDPEWAALRDPPTQHGILLWLSLCVWMAYFVCRRPPGRLSRGDAVWLSFRDRYGLMWSLRAQDQFNRAAFHAGLRQRLTWSGFRDVGPADRISPASGQNEEEQRCALLLSVLQRFGVQNPVSR